ncbi:hypothetical protein M9H77_17707 [Catharanthus roseus]|uniref:Uncharacterized protein n=1 Tax=Catharanthus roseus TaxID=4058 RepID=A0ACC0B5F2_CATRO|nr:hypothetical protein M9H77_17707 [Catharanthus roseus]
MNLPSLLVWPWQAAGPAASRGWAVGLAKVTATVSFQLQSAPTSLEIHVYESWASRTRSIIHNETIENNFRHPKVSANQTPCERSYQLSQTLDDITPSFKWIHPRESETVHVIEEALVRGVATYSAIL